jgi:hypothetical protein
MVVDTINWFHQVMGHPGEKRLHETLNQRYHHPKLHYHIDRLKCKDCQKYILAGHGYDLLPEQEVRITPWEEVSIRSTKQDDIYGASNIVLPCPGS